MSNKLLIVILSGVAILLLGGYLVYSLVSAEDNVTQSNSESQQSQPISNSESVSVETFTLQDVSQRNSSNDCWTVIENKVYDLTRYLSSHPGGSEIEKACGIDSTTLFNERKTEDDEAVGSGTPHSQRAKSSLSEFYVGDLR